MEVVPVIDLKGGVVVRARHGNRAAYRPIKTPLSQTSDPLDVVAGLLSVHPFRTLYIADLDAIEAKGNAAAILDSISNTFPELAIWVDNGCSELSGAQTFLARLGPAIRGLTSPLRGGRRSPDAEQIANFGRGVRRKGPPPETGGAPLAGFDLLSRGRLRPQPPTSLVLGSESQRDRDLVCALRDDPRVILSLDFHGDRFVGPDELLSEPELWPERIIVMTLARVGSDAGPDFDRHAAIRERAGGRAIYLAGGLRDRRDLAAVGASGAAGILVASALHDGRITTADLTPA